MGQSIHTLTVTQKIPETPDSVSLVFEIPESLKKSFAFEAGQYVTIERKIAGTVIRRSYSICNAPFEDELKVNIKKVKGGRMSSYIVDQLRVGDQLVIGTPEGNFIANFDGTKRRNHYFIAAGSGITPVLSLIKQGLEAEPMSTFVLLYGNKNEEHIIFNKKLDELKDQYGDQLQLRHTLSQVKSGGKLFGLFGKSKSSWAGWTGRIDGSKMTNLLIEIPAHPTENNFYLCGPGEMITKIQKWIEQSDIPNTLIHKEYFSNPDQRPGQVLTSQAATLIYKNLHGKDGEVKIPENKTILESLMDAGTEPPYSCMNGVCSSCVAKMVRGNVEMETCLALEDDEIAAGYILTCQSHPLTPEIEIEYDS